MASVWDQFQPYQAPAAAPQDAGDTGDDGQPLTGEDFLKTLDPGTAARVKAYVEGRTIPVGNARSPAVQSVKNLAAQYDPGFDETMFAKRNKTLQSFTGQGRNALEKKAINTAITHADNLSRDGGLIDQLGNVGMAPEWINPAIQSWKNLTGDSQFQAIKGQYDAQVEGLAGELSKMVNGGQTAESDRQHWREVLNRVKSPAELHAAIKQAMEMAEGRAHSLGQLYTEGMGTDRVPLEMIDPGNRAVFDRLRGLSGGAAATGPQPPTPQAAIPEGATATAQNGHKIVRKAGAWVDAQTGQPVQ